MKYKILKKGNWISRNVYFRLYWFKKYGIIKHVLKAYLKLHSDKEKICFVQIGTNNEIGDPVEWLISENWNCLLVEPDYDIYLSLLEKYDTRKFIIENSAVSDKREEATFYAIQPDPELPAWITQLNSFKKEFSEDIKQRFGSAKVDERKIKAITFDDLCDKHQLKDIDILQIDTEGYDFKVLSSVDFGKRNIDLIIYEHRHLSKKERKKARKLLFARHYILLRDQYDTIAFSNKSLYKYLIE